MPTTILLPIAGQAKRFVDIGVTVPKPLIGINGTPMIRLAIDSLLKGQDPKEFKLLFIVREDHNADNAIVASLKNILPEWDIDAVVVDPSKQRGTLYSCLEAEDKIDQDAPLIIYTPDVMFESKFDITRDFVNTSDDGVLLTFKANSKDHSYVVTDTDGYGIKTAEKMVISNNAIVGVYGYRSGRMFVQYGRKAIAQGVMHKNEYYVAPMYNLLIADDMKIKTHLTDKMYVLGTPDDVAFYENYVFKYDGDNTICLCCDHSGYVLKEELKEQLDRANIKFKDFGAFNDASSDHHDFIVPCIEYMRANPHAIGIGVCHTGQGFNIAANKASGVRSAVVYDAYTGQMARRHNAANFFCLPSRAVAPTNVMSIIHAILNNSFDGGRHATRIQKFLADPSFHE